MSAKTEKVSLVDYARKKRAAELRASCPICALPDAVREQLRQARPKKIPRAVVLAWLTGEMGIKVTSPQLDTHNQGKHDVEAA